MKKKPLVYLDYGHYKGISGHCSPDGQIQEYAVVREIGKYLKAKLIKAGIAVSETHPEELPLGSKDEDLSSRCIRANNWYKEDNKDHECIFVSLHTDATNLNTWSSASGCSMYICCNSSVKSKTLQGSYLRMFNYYNLLGNRRGAARVIDFYVLKHTKMPAILVENLFITNKDDCKVLSHINEDNRLVLAHFTAIRDYFVSVGAEL